MDHRRHFLVEGEARPESEWPPVKSLHVASPDYFRTLGIPLLSGREFLDSDRSDAPPVVIINRALAGQAWRGANPLGRRISFDAGEHWFTIVGVVGDTKEFGLISETPFGAYLAESQFPQSASILVRTAGDAEAVTTLVRRAVLEVDPETAITDVETLEQARENSVAAPRTTTRMFSLFAMLAFLIALAGIGSMLALWVRQRTREIGIRMAMGARPRHILAMVIRQGMLLVVIGLVAGYVGAISLTQFISTFLFQVDPTDGATYATTSAILLVAALIACFLPAMRAARIDPQLALRCE
jgi:predicted permease